MDSTGLSFVVVAVGFTDAGKIGFGGVVAKFAFLLSVVASVGLLAGLFAVTGVLVVALLHRDLTLDLERPGANFDGVADLVASGGLILAADCVDVVESVGNNDVGGLLGGTGASIISTKLTGAKLGAGQVTIAVKLVHTACRLRTNLAVACS